MLKQAVFVKLCKTAFFRQNLVIKMESIGVIEIIGTAAFSVAGAFAAKEKKLDIFGVFIIAFITALGGGTLRDILIGKVPVS